MLRLSQAYALVFGVGLVLALTSAVSAQTKPAPNKSAAKVKQVPSSLVAQHGTYNDYRSQRFIMHTDLPADEVTELFTRLETMLDLISEYWAAPSRGVIEMYVIKDLKNWPPGSLDESGRSKVAAGGGVTLTTTLGFGQGKNREVVDAKSIVYAGADHGTPQHEAVHAYCGQTFGRTGPVWYSEGMAEMGNYWKRGQKEVDVHPVVVKHLRDSQIKTLNDIVNSNETTGDSWQNYAWRWALCHLLANNTNYQKDFRPLGLSILKNQGLSFESVYGKMAEEISFEYKFFIEHLENGFRVDLCSWDWAKKFTVVRGSVGPTTKILADHGWQPTQATLQANQDYEYTATGTWQISADGQKVTARGDSDGNGRLEGVMMTGFVLGEPFDLDAQGTITAPADGNLYVRCKDKWIELADNKGTMTFKIKAKKE